VKSRLSLLYLFAFVFSAMSAAAFKLEPPASFKDAAHSKYFAYKYEAEKKKLWLYRLDTDADSVKVNGECYNFVGAKVKGLTMSPTAANANITVYDSAGCDRTEGNFVLERGAVTCGGESDKCDYTEGAVVDENGNVTVSPFACELKTTPVMNPLPSFEGDASVAVSSPNYIYAPVTILIKGGLAAPVCGDAAAEYKIVAEVTPPGSTKSMTVDAVFNGNIGGSEECSDVAVLGSGGQTVSKLPKEKAECEGTMVNGLWKNGKCVCPEGTKETEIAAHVEEGWAMIGVCEAGTPETTDTLAQCECGDIWMVKFTPTNAGDHKIVLKAEGEGLTLKETKATASVGPDPYFHSLHSPESIYLKGLLSRDEDDGEMRFSNGESFVMLGLGRRQELFGKIIENGTIGKENCHIYEYARYAGQLGLNTVSVDPGADAAEALLNPVSAFRMMNFIEYSHTQGVAIYYYLNKGLEQQALSYDQTFNLFEYNNAVVWRVEKESEEAVRKVAPPGAVIAVMPAAPTRKPFGAGAFGVEEGDPTFCAEGKNTGATMATFFAALKKGLACWTWEADSSDLPWDQIDPQNFTDAAGVREAIEQALECLDGAGTPEGSLTVGACASNAEECVKFTKNDFWSEVSFTDGEITYNPEPETPGDCPVGATDDTPKDCPTGSFPTAGNESCKCATGQKVINGATATCEAPGATDCPATGNFPATDKCKCPADTVKKVTGTTAICEEQGTSDGICSITDTFAETSECACPTGFKKTTEATRCECAGTACQCPADYTLQGKLCTKGTGNTTGTCSATATLEPTDTCECPTGYKKNTAKTKCEPVAACPTKEPFLVDPDCVCPANEHKNDTNTMCIPDDATSKPYCKTGVEMQKKDECRCKSGTDWYPKPGVDGVGQCAAEDPYGEAKKTACSSTGGTYSDTDKTCKCEKTDMMTDGADGCKCQGEKMYVNGACVTVTADEKACLDSGGTYNGTACACSTEKGLELSGKTCKCTDATMQYVKADDKCVASSTDGACPTTEPFPANPGCACPEGEHKNPANTMCLPGDTTDKPYCKTDVEMEKTDECQCKDGTEWYPKPGVDGVGRCSAEDPYGEAKKTACTSTGGTYSETDKTCKCEKTDMVTDGAGGCKCQGEKMYVNGACVTVTADEKACLDSGGTYNGTACACSTEKGLTLSGKTCKCTDATMQYVKADDKCVASSTDGACPTTEPFPANPGCACPENEHKNTANTMCLPDDATSKPYCKTGVEMEQTEECRCEDPAKWFGKPGTKVGQCAETDPYGTERGKACTDSGGTYANNACTCDATKKLMTDGAGACKCEGELRYVGGLCVTVSANDKACLDTGGTPKGPTCDCPAANGLETDGNGCACTDAAKVYDKTLKQCIAGTDAETTLTTAQKGACTKSGGTVSTDEKSCDCKAPLTQSTDKKTCKGGTKPASVDKVPEAQCTAANGMTWTEPNGPCKCTETTATYNAETVKCEAATKPDCAIDTNIESTAECKCPDGSTWNAGFKECDTDQTDQ
jgi:hypothetical protein